MDIYLANHCLTWSVAAVVGLSVTEIKTKICPEPCSGQRFKALTKNGNNPGSCLTWSCLLIVEEIL